MLKKEKKMERIMIKVKNLHPSRQLGLINPKENTPTYILYPFLEHFSIVLVCSPLCMKTIKGEHYESRHLINP